MNSKKFNHKQFLIGLSFICLSLIQAKSAMPVPTTEEYEQFRGGVYVPECDPDFDIPKFIAVQREGGLTGKIDQARFDGEEAKSLILAVGGSGSCTYYRTNSGKIHKIARFSRYFGYNGEPIKELLSPPNEKDSIFIDSNGKKHTIEHLDQERSQSNPQMFNGWYIAESHTDAVIEIKTNQYCGANLETGSIECYPISDLKYIRPGVVKFGNGEDTYFCSQDFFKINPSGYGKCMANGWIEIRR